MRRARTSKREREDESVCTVYLEEVLDVLTAVQGGDVGGELQKVL